MTLFRRVEGCEPQVIMVRYQAECNNLSFGIFTYLRVYDKSLLNGDDFSIRVLGDHRNLKPNSIVIVRQVGVWSGKRIWELVED